MGFNEYLHKEADIINIAKKKATFKEGTRSLTEDEMISEQALALRKVVDESLEKQQADTSNDSEVVYVIGDAIAVIEESINDQRARIEAEKSKILHQDGLGIERMSGTNRGQLFKLLEVIKPPTGQRISIASSMGYSISLYPANDRTADWATCNPVKDMYRTPLVRNARGEHIKGYDIKKTVLSDIAMMVNPPNRRK